MIVKEIFYSIQGEGLHVGCPMIFVRFVGCNLRCSYCDTKYSYSGGKKMNWRSILQQLHRIREKYHVTDVCITGGEPLLQRGIEGFLKCLSKEGYETWVETNGSVSLPFDFRYEKPHTCHFVVDYKLPSSGMEERMLPEMWDRLGPWDVVKFVTSNVRDFKRAFKLLEKNDYLAASYVVIFSPVYGKISLKKLAELIIKYKVKARLQIQLHKLIWGVNKRGV